MMDCDTTGVEPDIALVKYKQLVGEGMLKIVNQTVPAALRKLGYDARAGRGDPRLHRRARDDRRGARTSRPSTCRSSTARSSRSTASGRIHYMGHVRMMGAIQPFLSGAISKTVNMPEAATAGAHRGRLPRGLEAGPQGHRDLSRRHQAEPAAQHGQEEGRRRRDRHRCRRRAAEPSSPSPRPRRRSPIAGGCRSSGRR